MADDPILYRRKQKGNHHHQSLNKVATYSYRSKCKRIARSRGSRPQQIRSKRSTPPGESSIHIEAGISLGCKRCTSLEFQRKLKQASHSPTILSQRLQSRVLTRLWDTSWEAIHCFFAATRRLAQSFSGVPWAVFCFPVVEVNLSLFQKKGTYELF